MMTLVQERERPLPRRGGGGRGGATRTSSNGLCYRWQRAGACRFGGNCRFAHSSWLATPDDPPLRAPPPPQVVGDGAAPHASPPPRERWGQHHPRQPRATPHDAPLVARTSTAPLPRAARWEGEASGRIAGSWWTGYGRPVADDDAPARPGRPVARLALIPPAREAWGAGIRARYAVHGGAEGELHRTTSAPGPMAWQAVGGGGGSIRGWAYGRPLRTTPSREAWGSSMPRRAQRQEASQSRQQGRREEPRTPGQTSSPASAHAGLPPPFRRRAGAGGGGDRDLMAQLMALEDFDPYWDVPLPRFPASANPRRIEEFYELLLFLDEGNVTVGVSEKQFNDEVKDVEYCAADHDGEMCTVCLDAFSEDTSIPMVRLPCGHLFHAGCVKEWLASHTRCPVCNWQGWKETTVRRGGGTAARTARSRVHAHAHARPHTTFTHNPYAYPDGSVDEPWSDSDASDVW